MIIIIFSYTKKKNLWKKTAVKTKQRDKDQSNEVYETTKCLPTGSKRDRTSIHFSSGCAERLRWLNYTKAF